MNRRMMQLAVVAAAMTGVSASAATLAHWNFEQVENLSSSTFVPAVNSTLTANQHVPADPQPYSVDASGNGNRLQIWTDGPAPSYFSNDVPRATIGSGAANNRSYVVQGRDLWTSGSPAINSADLSGGWTIEASVKAANLDAWQVFVSKDRSSASNEGSDFAFKFNPDSDRLFLMFRGGDNVRRELYLPFTVQQNTWYDLAAAATYDGANTTVSLYAKLSTEDVFGTPETTTFAASALPATPATWLIGRGFWWDNADFVQGDGAVDEVRISDVALSPNQFLMSVPEPAALSLLGLGAIALMRRQRA